MLTIKVEASPGSEIEETFEEAIGIAKKLNCRVKFDFNGVKCIASPKGNAQRGADRYSEALQSEDSHKCASA
jgi:sugar/nucleoside kinase (ribokinase family)